MVDVISKSLTTEYPNMHDGNMILLESKHSILPGDVYTNIGSLQHHVSGRLLTY